MQYSNVVVLSTSQQPTMSSLEMVEYINDDRASKAKSEGLTFPCKKYRRLQHKDLLKKVPKVLDENHSAKFFAQYKDSTGRDLAYYHEKDHLLTSMEIALCHYHRTIFKLTSLISISQ